MAQLLNTLAALTWTDPTDTTGTERVHLLSVPLRALSPGYSQMAYTAESLDRTARETYSIGTGAHELVGTLRYDRNAQGLVDVVRAGMLNTTLNYYPNLSDPTVVYPVKLISPTDLTALALQLDAQRGVLGDQMVEVRFRRTDQSSFQPLYAASPVLFRYTAGGALTGMTFSRAGTADYAAKGFSVLTQAGSGAARIDWWDLDGDGVAETPALLLEGARTNLVASSSTFGSWTAVNTPTLTTGQGDPAGSTGATLIADTGAVNQSYVKITPTFTGSVAKAVSVFVRQGTSLAAGGSAIQLTDTTATADRLLATVTWSNGTPSVAMTTGTYLGSKRYTGGWFRLLFQTTAVTAADTHELRLLPAVVANQTGNGYFFGAQAEDGLNATSYIPTSGSTVARVRDDLQFNAPWRVQTLTMYIRLVQLGTMPSIAATTVAACLGQSSASASRFEIDLQSTGLARAAIGGVATASSGSITPGATQGQVVEYVATFRVTGTTATCQLQAAVNGTLGSAGTVSAAAQVSDTFAGAKGAFNEIPGSSTVDGFAPFLNLLVVRGAVDYYGCRRLAGLQL